MSPLHIDMQNLSVSEEVGWPLSYLEVALERFPRPVGTTGDLLREPTSAWSFSRVPESKIKENMQLYVDCTAHKLHSVLSLDVLIVSRSSRMMRKRRSRL